jgi:hypothetical protein
MNRYTYEFKSNCPNNDEYINYKLIITTKEIIMVESIVEYISMNHQSSYHEVIADDLIKVFSGEHYMCASHHGVVIETWRKK